MPDKPSLYLETTIPSYLAARPSRDLIVAAHQQTTNAWWQQERDRFRLFISEAVLDEINFGDADAIARRQPFVETLPILSLTDEVATLAQEYKDQMGLPPNAQLDALHLAYAVTYDMDYLLTWNCKHIANGVFIQRLQAINIAANLHIPIIVTPDELFSSSEGE